jgi:transposase-like protein
MKSSQHSAEQIVKIIQQAERDEQTIAAICREHGIAENTFYRWRKAYGGMLVTRPIARGTICAATTVRSSRRWPFKPGLPSSRSKRCTLTLAAPGKMARTSVSMAPSAMSA